MLRNVNDLYGYTVAASDGLIGEVRDLYFDDAAWTIRFLVVETGPWLAGRNVLISSIALCGLDAAGKMLSASTTLDQVKRSPDVDTSKPVSRQHEVEQFGYYGYPNYWGEPQLWGGGPRPGMSLAGYPGVQLANPPPSTTGAAEAFAKRHRNRGDDPHLRSCRAVERYHLHATDGAIGHVESLLVDDESWAVRYLVVNTSDWWLGHQMLIAPPWITDISWLDATVSVDLTRQAIKDAPPFDANTWANREPERGLFEHPSHPDRLNAGAAPPAA
jgi:hypothetical protein